MIEQRSVGWYSARIGMITASRVADLMNGTKEKQQLYMMQLAAERLTGMSEEFYVSKPMQRGIELEETAKKVFMFETGVSISETGFWTHKDITGWGASPDGICCDGGLIEIKCPNTNTHLSYLKDRKFPDKYKPQVQCQLAVTGYPFAYFMSFDDRLPKHLQCFITRVERDEDYIVKMQNKVTTFLNDLEDLINNYHKEALCQTLITPPS